MSRIRRRTRTRNRTKPPATSKTVVSSFGEAEHRTKTDELQDRTSRGATHGTVIGVVAGLIATGTISVVVTYGDLVIKAGISFGS